jgi:hypothetical protein
VADNKKPLNATKTKKSLTGIYDPEIDLGYQLKMADAPNLGRDVAVTKKLLAAKAPANKAPASASKTAPAPVSKAAPAPASKATPAPAKTTRPAPKSKGLFGWF